MDFHFVTFLSSMTNDLSFNSDIYKNSPCSIGIFTTGNNHTLAFCNEPHLDTADVYNSDKITKFLYILEDQMDLVNSRVQTEDSEIRKNAVDIYNYVCKFNEVVTLGVPTTCAYQHVLADQTSTLVQFFIMEGLGSAVYLPNFVGHNFISHSFVHHTSLCLAVDKQGRVWVDNKNEEKEIGYLFAWGGSGKARTTTANA